MRRSGFVLVAVLVAASAVAILVAALGAAVRQGLALSVVVGEAADRAALTRQTVERLKYDYRMHGLPEAREFDVEGDGGTLHVRVEYAPERQGEVALHVYRVTAVGDHGTTTQVIWLPAGERHA